MNIRKCQQKIRCRGYFEPLRRRVVRLRLLTGAALLVLATLTASTAQTKRIVILKVDGLPYDMIDRFAAERDPLTGKSRLPWFDYVFYRNGTRITNFYVRGMSLSAPSWSLIDTGQHLQIKGNVEFDRDILHTYDYLNFLPFLVKQATRGNVDMPGTEVLDSVRVPMLVDAYDNYQRLPGSQLYGRGARIKTLQLAAENKFLRNPKQLATEFVNGLETRNIVADQLERELIDKLDDQRVGYLDLLTMDFDHTAHHNNDRESHLATLQQIDALIGRLWTAIQKSPMAPDTAFVVVSDHGFNSDERVISQGFNLVKLLGSYYGGGHHVITKRRLLMDYSIKAVNPFVPPITTTTSQSYYLKDQSAEYPTALLDFDGNERAGLHLRNTNLNVIHILFQQLQRNLSAQVRTAATDAFFAAIDHGRPFWQQDLDDFDQQLAALKRATDKQQELCLAQPKKFTLEDIEHGRDDDARRICILAKQWDEFLTSYRGYVATMRNLLTLKRDTFDPQKIKVETIIPTDSMGRRNSIHDLQNYVVGLGKDGLVLKSDGSLDADRSFVRLNYFDLLHEQAVRNNVQPEVSTHPIDFIATRIPREMIAPSLSDELKPEDDVVWLYGGPDRQALILPRGERSGELQLRYLPIANLTQNADGLISFDPSELKPDFPLRILEDARLALPPNADRVAWLGQWHTDLEWLQALHRTQYSNGLIGLHEQFTLFPAPGTDPDAPNLTADETLLRAFHKRQRRLVECDFMVFANNHWNFDVRGFNPGGNHGSLFRISTHATLLFAGGDQTQIPRGLAVSEPYDSLSVVPTILALTRKLDSDNRPVEALAKRGFVRFPGRVITEVAGRDFANGPAH